MNKFLVVIFALAVFGLLIFGVNEIVHEMRPVHGVVIEKVYEESYTKRVRRKRPGTNIYRWKTITVPAYYYVIVKQDGDNEVRKVKVNSENFTSFTKGQRYDDK